MYSDGKTVPDQQQEYVPLSPSAVVKFVSNALKKYPDNNEMIKNGLSCLVGLFSNEANDVLIGDVDVISTVLDIDARNIDESVAGLLWSLIPVVYKRCCKKKNHSSTLSYTKVDSQFIYIYSERRESV